MFKKRDKGRREQAHRLADWVGAQPPPQSWPGADRPRVAAVGRGVLEEFDPEIGPHVTECVFVLTDEAFYYQYLEEAPKEIKSAKGRALGFSPAEWAEMARRSTTCICLRELEGTDGRRAVDGRWDLLFVPKGANDPAEVTGFGVIECYERPNQKGSDIPYLDRPEDVAHIVRLWNPTDISRKLDKGEHVSVTEIVSGYGESEPGPMGLTLPSPESMRMIARMSAEAEKRRLLVKKEQT